MLDPRPLPQHYRIRPANRADLDEIVAIEASCCIGESVEAWRGSDFLDFRARHATVILLGEILPIPAGRKKTAVTAGHPVGFICYEFHPRRIQMVNMGVYPSWRRKGIGGSLLNELQMKLSPGGRRELRILAPAELLKFQLWLRSRGIRADCTRYVDGLEFVRFRTFAGAGTVEDKCCGR